MNINPEKYERQISLLCSTCGSSQFCSDESIEESERVFECMSCGKKTTKDDLIRENSENIDEHVKEIGKQAVADLTKELQASLKKLRFK